MSGGAEPQLGRDRRASSAVERMTGPLEGARLLPTARAGRIESVSNEDRGGAYASRATFAAGRGTSGDPDHLRYVEREDRDDRSRPDPRPPTALAHDPAGLRPGARDRAPSRG